MNTMDHDRKHGWPMFVRQGEDDDDNYDRKVDLLLGRNERSQAMKNQPIRSNRPTLIDHDDDVDVSLISSRRERSEAMRNQSSPRDDWHTLMRDNDKDLEVNRLTTREEKSQAMKNQFVKTKNRPILVRQGDDDDGEVQLISTKQQKSQAMKTQSVKADKRSMILFKYIKDKSWKDVLQHLDYYERDAYNWIEEVNDDGTKRWRSLPIHLVSAS
jgi:hypothetical protein